MYHEWDMSLIVLLEWNLFIWMIKQGSTIHTSTYATSPWLLGKYFLLANKRMLLAIIHTIYLQYVFI